MNGNGQRYMWRKKFSLTCMLWATGSALAFHTNAELGAYTTFSLALLGTFGVSDLIDKEKIGMLQPKPPTT